MPKEFLKQIVTLNICDMINMPVVSGTGLYARINGQLLFSERKDSHSQFRKKKRFRPLKTLPSTYRITRNRFKCYDLQEHKAKQYTTPK